MNSNNINDSNNTLSPKYRQIRIPSGGFILKKDVYTTNLLYSDDRFSKNLILKNLKFRKPPIKITLNASKSLTILHENYDNLTKLYDKNGNLTYTKKKSKNNWNKIHLPLPRINAKSMSAFNLNKNFCSKNVAIRFMEDDLNITSTKGRKINYNFKGSNTHNYFYTDKNLSNDFKENDMKKRYRNRSNKNLKKNKQHYIQLDEFYKIDYKPRIYSNKFLYFDKNEKNMMPVNLITSMINSNLKNIIKEDKDNKKLLFRNTFFTTQVNTNNKTSYKRKKIFI